MKAKSFTKETIRNIGTTKLTHPTFAVGDTIAISQRIREGDKERLQVFQGDVIGMHNNGISSTFTVRKIGANGIPVERIFPFYSPLIDSIKIVRKGDVRRAKLYYIRDRVGKAARVQELVLTKEEKLAQMEESQETRDEVKEETVQEDVIESLSGKQPEHKEEETTE